MKPERLAGVAGFASGATVVLSLFAFILVREISALKARLHELQQAHGRLTAEAARWQDQRAADMEARARLQAELERLQTESRPPGQDKTATPPAGKEGMTRAHFYAGARYLGSGWIHATPGATSGPVTVVLDSTGAPSSAANTAAAALSRSTAFSAFYHFPTWPYLWTVGWLVGEPTNHCFSTPGSEPPSSPPAVAPVSPATPAPGPVAPVSRVAMRGRPPLLARPPAQPVPRPPITLPVPAAVATRQLSPAAVSTKAGGAILPPRSVNTGVPVQRAGEISRVR